MLSIIFSATANTLAGTEDSCLDFHVINSEPVGFLNANNTPQGVHWDYLTAIAKESGICINKNLYPYPRIWASLKLGNHDGGIVFSSEVRSEYVDYVSKIRSMKTVVIPLRNKKINVYQDLSKLTIGKVRGAHLNSIFDGDENLTVIRLNTYDQVVNMINLERIDAVAGSALVLNHQLNKDGVLPNVNLDESYTLGYKEQWLQLSKNSKHLDKREQLQTAVNTLQRNGTFDKIMQKYYGANWKKINSGSGVDRIAVN